jgi:predicted nucleotidyltransferase
MPKRSFGSVKIFSLDPAAIREALRRHIDQRYRPDPNIVAVHLFGSFARGRAVPGSDVDLLVILERDPRPPRDRIPDHLPGGFPVGVDVVVWTRAEMEERLARHDRLARTILAEGELLFDRGSTSRQQGDTPWPSAAKPGASPTSSSSGATTSGNRT